MSTRTASEVREELRHARAHDRVAGAYLLEGPAGTGKTDTAHWLSRLLLCHAEGPEPCERCEGCRRSRLDPDTGTPLHGDWQRVVPDGASLKIDQVRALQRALSLTSQERGRRVGLLLHAERLTLEAANALLKTLEEPPPDTTLILVTRSADALPATIRSRSVRLRFRPESRRPLAERLEAQGHDPRAAWLAATLAGGSEQTALDWLEQHLETARELWAPFSGGTGAGDADGARRLSDGERLEFAETFRGRGEAVLQRLDLFLDVFEAISGEELRREVVRDPPRRRDVERCLDRLERVAEARRELVRRNLNPQMVVEGLLFSAP